VDFRPALDERTSGMSACSAQMRGAIAVALADFSSRPKGVQTGLPVAIAFHLPLRCQLRPARLRCQTSAGVINWQQAVQVPLTCHLVRRGGRR